MYEPNKLECYNTVGCKSLSGINSLAYWAHLYVIKNGKCCEYDPCGLYYKSFKIVIYDRNDSGQYCKAMITAKPSLSLDRKLQSYVTPGNTKGEVSLYR